MAASSATYHSVGLPSFSPPLPAARRSPLPQVLCTAAVTVAIVATAVECPAAAALCTWVPCQFLKGGKNALLLLFIIHEGPFQHTGTAFQALLGGCSRAMSE